MAILKGIPVVLITKTSTEKDAFNRPIETEARATVDNVLVSPLSQTDVAVISELNLNGKKARYQLAIPKGDTHNWKTLRSNSSVRGGNQSGSARKGLKT